MISDTAGMVQYGSGQNGLQSYAKQCGFYTQELKGNEQKFIPERLV